jgi:hypothetical protein
MTTENLFYSDTGLLNRAVETKTYGNGRLAGIRYDSSQGYMFLVLLDTGSFVEVTSWNITMTP